MDVARNHQLWFAANARAAGGEVRASNGTAWVAGGGEATLGFPDEDAALDEILAACRAIPSMRQVACWAADPLPACRRLGARLLARGFEWGWQPHWMGIELAGLVFERYGPAELEVGLVPTNEAAWTAADLPNYDAGTLARYRAQAAAEPRTVWRFAARLDGQVVGHSAVHVGPADVAGIYDVGVVPTMRGRGIGKAVTTAALRQAVALGCRVAVLNSTGMGEPVYRRLCFRSLGFGQTWWMHRPQLHAPPVAAAEVALVEAIGDGGSDLLLSARRVALDTTLRCGLTPLGVAVQLRMPTSAEALVAAGATLDVISAWDLGWRDRAAALLAAHPDLANRRGGGFGATPLREAVMRGDMDLARLVLSASPDLSIADTSFHSTALGWARHFGRAELIALIEGRD